MRVVLLPVKDPVRAKQRLAGFLSPAERKDLAWAMLTDVGTAVSGCRLADRIVVVARDPEVVRYAAGNHWEVLRETEQISENHSVDWASALLDKQGVKTVLRLPVDIPLVQAQDLDALLGQASTGPLAVLVPSQDGLGTNALLRSPPVIFPSRFGSNSLQLHLREGRGVGLKVQVKEMPRVALDLDQASDLIQFRAIGKGTVTEDVLHRLSFKGWLTDSNRSAHASS